MAMLLVGGAVYGLSATPAFGFRQLAVSGNVLVPEAAVRAAVSVRPGTNLVGLDTTPIVNRLRTISAIDAVDVAVGLPDTLEVHLRERSPIVVWAVGDRRFAVDDDGLLFADVTGDAGKHVAGIPVVRDERKAMTALKVGTILDPVDRDAATRLGSVTASQLGSHAATLTIRITDDRGFTVGSGAGGWLAVFGFYGRSQRTPALIPGQIQLLTSLLAGREDTVQTVILADDRDGTYVPKPTPKPSPSPRPSKAP
jgi:cell division septal protein FtsQ